MRETKTVHIHVTLEVELPSSTNVHSLTLGLAGSKVHDNFNTIDKAKILTWWIDRVTACNSIYVTCPQCNQVQLSSSDAVILDGKPLCILCSAKYEYGDLPVKRTPE